MTTRVLMIFPRFNPHSFFSYEGAREVLGAKYPATPLGMITLAALLPADWEIRLVNLNTASLTEADLGWAEIVMTGGMLAQQHDALNIIDVCKARGLPVAVGGPDVSSSPDIYARADFRVIGEAEDIIHDFIAAWRRGERSGTFEAEKFQVDVTKSPTPRFDLLKFEDYLFVGVQFSRGCPFTCEFCDIIELYGRNPRAKTTEQMLRELDRLRELGYRGHVDFVDDNLIGNKKAVKAFLPHLIAWQKRNRYPFMFTTEASLNIAEDLELMKLMRDANFVGFFVGLESPDPDTLKQTSKKQNLKREIPDCVTRIYEHGMFVLPGFVLGFDAEKPGISDAIMQCLEDAAIPMGIFSLLYALPGTQLTRRLEKEGRLHPDIGLDTDRKQGDFTIAGLNFETKRPREDILREFGSVLRRLYEPDAYFGRVRRALMTMRRAPLPVTVLVREALGEIDKFFRFMWEVTLRRPDMRWRVWRLVAECLVRNPANIRNAVVMSVFYYFLSDLSRIWVAEVERRLANGDAGNPKKSGASELALAATTA